MEDLSKYSTEELEAMLQDSPQPQSAQPAQTQAPQAAQAQADDMPDLSQYSTEDLERMIGEQGTAAGRIEQMFNVGTDRRDNINPLEEAAKGAGRAVKAIGGAFVGLGSGAVRLAGTPVRALTGWDGLHRVADAIDSGYEDWGSEALASELPDDDWGRVLGGFGEKMAGTAGSLGAMAAGGGLAKLGAAGKFGAASKAVGMAGVALQKSLPFMFGNDAAVRTYDTAKENGSGTARALGLAAVNGAIHYFGFKAFENQSLNKMLGMPQEMGAMMPAWANAARAGGAKTFTELASGVRNGMFKYILAERAKGALKAGGIMGLQNFLSSVPTQMSEGASVGDVDWGRAVSEGVGGMEEGALMEALMGGAAALKTPKTARKFIADTYFRNGYKLPNGQHVPGLLHSEEGRAFVMKQNPEMQRRILDILDHGGKVTKGELNAACLPPDMTEAELLEFAKDWRKDLASEWDRAAEPETLGEGEELDGNEPVIPREQQMRNRAKVNEMRDHEQRVAEAEEAERARAEEQAADDAAVAAEEAKWAGANAKADAERADEAAGAEQLAREEAYPRPVVEQPAAPEQAPAQEHTEPSVAERSNRLRRNLKPNFRHQGENQQPKEVTNETGNVPVEAQPEPSVQDARRGGQQQAPQAAEGLVEGEASRGEVSAAGEVDAKPETSSATQPTTQPAVRSTPAPRQDQKPIEQKPVSKPDRGGQKMTGGAKEEATPPATQTEPPAAEPPKTAPASAQSAEGTTTPPQSSDAPQGGESAAGGATGGAAEEPKPTQGNKLRRGKKGKKLEAQESKADAATATQEATPEREPVFENEQLEKAYRMIQSGVEKDVRAGEDLALETISKMRGHELQKLYTMTPTDDAFEKIIDIATGEVNDRMISDEPIPEGTIPDRKDPTPETPEAPAAKDNKLKPAAVAKRGRKANASAEPEAAPATQEATPAPTADGQTQPASQFRDKNGNMKKTLRGAVERISLAIGNRTGKGAITPEEADAIVNGIAESPEVKHNRTRQFFTPLVTDAEWQNSLGVDAESAKNLRDAVARAKTDSEMAHFFVQVDKAVKKAEAGKLSSKDAVPLNGKISEGLEKAEREGRHEAAKRLREALEVIKPVVDAVSQEDVDKFNRSAKGKKLHTQLDGSDRRRGSRGKTVSLDTKDGTVDVGVDGKTLEDVADEISDSSHDRRTLKPGESYGKGFTAKSDNDTTGTEGTRQGSTGKGGDLAGKRAFQIVERNGDDITVAMRVPKKGVIKQTVKLSQLRRLAESDTDIKQALDSLEKGGELRASKPASESPASRDARFAADADYQRWLKSRKANDAEPLRQRYEMEQAKALGDAFKNAVGGVDFEYVGDRDYDPTKDGGGDGRKSIGGIYTGTAADYANRSRQGGVDDGPSLKKIGTGEGAQVYGWGLYGSTVRGVAEKYARLKEVRGIKSEKRGKTSAQMSEAEGLAAYYFEQNNGNVEAAKRDLREYIEHDKENERLVKSLTGALKELEEHGAEYEMLRPHLYEQTFFTNRAEGDESHLLKWYEPVTREQIGWIESRLKAEGIGNVNMPFLKGELPNPDNPSGGPANAKIKNGRTVYDHLANKLGSPQAASEFLARAGIDGVKYPVDSYGGKGVKDGDTAGWNYVSFRDDNIRVDHKWEDGNLRYLRDRDTGTVLGIFDRDTGKLKLFRGANWKTLNHELGGHATMRFAEQEAARGNRALLDKINESIDNAPQWLKDEVKSRYPDADEATLRDEIWAALRERPSEAMQKYVKTLHGRKWYNRAWDTIKTAWRGILSRMGFNRADLSGIDKMTPDEFNDFLDNAMIGGKTLGRIETAPPQSSVRMARGGERGASERDKKYRDAIARGDMETAQRMVREAADRAGYGKIGFHGTTYKRGKFTTFQKGSHIGSEVYQALNRIGVETDGPMAKEQIDLIIEDLRRNGNDVLSLRVKLNNPLRISDFGDDWSGKDFVRRLYSEHPELFSNVEWAEMMKDPSRAHQMIEGKGYDGLVYDNGSEGILDYSGDTPGRYKADGTYIPNDSYIPFHPSQIKSADAVTYDDAGNVIPLSQRFNRHSDDLRYSRGPAAPSNKDVQMYLDDKEGFWKKLRRMFQDKNVILRDVEERLGITKKEESAYYAKDAAYGKNEHELTYLQKQEVEPIVAKIEKSGGSLGLFSAYLYARHSGERNAVMKAEKGIDDGSGMNKAQADAIFSAVDRLGLRAAFEDAARDVWAMNRKYLQRRADSGRMTQAEVKFLLDRYKHYVPLRNDMSNEELEMFNSSTGGWKRNELRTAKGRREAADDPFAFSIVQSEEAIRASNANEARRKFAGVVRRAAAQGAPIGEVVDGENKGGATWSFVFKDGGRIDTGSPMRLASERDDIVLFKENGKLKAIKIDPGANGRGLDLARAVTDKDVARFNRHLEWIPRATRWMSAMRTQYVPTFIIRNMKADNLEVLLNALSERGVKGFKFFGKFVANEVSVAKGVKEYFKTGKSSDKYVQEAVENGLLTGGGMAAEGFSETTRRLSDTLAALRGGKKGAVGRAFGAAKDLISLLNSCAEYNTRMGVYKTLREEGMSVADAVSYARDVTVNFNRKGYLTPYTNAAFMFSNASIQGMGRAFKSIKSEHGKGVIAGLFLVGAAQAMLDDWLGHDDNDKSGGADSRNLTEFDKSHSLGVALPSGHRVKTGIRNPWALPVYMGRKTVELMKGLTSGEEAMKDITNEVGQFATEPVGGNGFGSVSEFLQTLAPTIIDPFVQWGTGKDYRGHDRVKKSFNQYEPDSWNGRNNTPEAYKAIAKALNFVSGGGEHRKGAFDTSPENWKLLTETVFGGVLTDVNNVISAGEHAVKAARGQPASQIVRDVPFVRDTFTNMPDSATRYYEAVDSYNADKNEFKKTTELGRRSEMKKEHPYLTAKKGRVDTLIEQVQELTHRERGEVKVGQKWVPMKTELPEARKEAFRKRRLRLQADVLRILGK